ncbi:MAG: UV DNA damage repair endonuclease UvsE [Gemmatimonadaceae bacterium]
MPVKQFTPRLGLCCTFANEPQLRFRTTTVAYLSRLFSTDPTGAVAPEFYEMLVRDNLTTLENVIRWCHTSGIHAFRINSDLWPRATHALVKPWVEQLFLNESIQAQFSRIRTLAEVSDIRLSEHPDQFLVGNSLRADVVDSTITELEWRGRLGDALGIDVICLHVGSGAPDRESALWRWDQTLTRLSPPVLSKLAFENDDRTFSPEQILPACLHWGLPMIYDVHHHRTLPDALSLDEATEFAIASWGNREPYFHLSSPRAGWNSGDSRPHHDYIDVSDWPSAWTELWNAGVAFTVDIEAKAKELAVFGLRSALGSPQESTGPTAFANSRLIELS